MPEAVSDLDDNVCCFTPSLFDPHLPHTLQGHFWTLGKVKLLGANQHSKDLFFHLHESPIGPKMLSGSREAKRGTCDYLCRGSVSLCRQSVAMKPDTSLTVYYINGALFILVLPIRGDPFNQATQKSFISLLVMYLVYSFCI